MNVRRFLRPLRRFKRDRRGVTAVEFGLVAMPLLATLCATFEVAYINIENEMLAAGVSSASRAMLTGTLQDSKVTSAAKFVSDYLCPPTGRLVPSNFDCSKLIVDVRSAASFVSGDLANNFYKSANNKFCPGAPGEIVVMRVAYPLKAIFPLSLMDRTVGLVNDVPGQPGWHHILMGATIFQAEAYTSNFTPPAGC